MKYDQVYTFLIQKLERELPPYLTYHSHVHTKDVIRVADFISQSEKLTLHDMQLLKTAALFHDAGFLEAYHNHEEASCTIARRLLPQFDYTTEEIDEICKLIMITRLPQKPTNTLEKILCDADMFYIGTDAYFDTAEKLHKEFKVMGIVKSSEEWHTMQIEFLESQGFFTQAAMEAYNSKKAENLNLLKNPISGKKPSRTNISKLMQDSFLIILGVIIAGFALKGFLVPNNFFDGGVTGISLLLHELYHFNLAYTIVLANLPLLIVSYFLVSRTFAIKTFVTVFLLGICLLYFPYITVTSDKLLISIFGGFFLGLGTGLTMRAGCALDGVEVLALYTLKKSSFTISEIILGINVLIFAIAAFKFGLETSLYSILTYFTASRTIDYVIEGIEAYTGVTIISGNSERIKHRLVNELGRGITVYKGERGYLPGKFEISSDCDIIFTVITRLELRRLKNLVYDTDPKAFVFANTIKEASGGIIKRRSREH